MFKNEGHRERAEAMIDGDIERLWGRDELAPAKMQYSSALGLPGRTFGVEELSDGRFSVQSEVIDVASGGHKFVDNIRSA